MTHTLALFAQNLDITTGDIGIILSIALLEGLLSVDNALVNASLAQGLPHAKERKMAIKIGIGLGALLRLVALFSATLIIQNPWIKLLGAGYLVFLAVKHLFFHSAEGGGDSEHGKHAKFWPVVRAIALADMAFSIDNVVAAVGMSPKFSIVVIGVLCGIVTMVFATQLMAVLIGRYPLLEKTAYAIVGFVGCSIFAEDLLHWHIDEMCKFLVIIGSVVGTIFYQEINRRLRKTHHAHGHAHAHKKAYKTSAE